MSSALFSNQMRGKVVRGLLWKGGSQFARQLLRIIVAVILARLLSPHDYGIAGMVIVFSALALIFSDLALGAALVQRDELTEEDRSTAFWTSLGAGVFFAVAGILLAGPIADLYGEPQVRWLFVALSFTFVLTSVGTTQAALLSRDLDFRRLELRLMGGALAGAVVGIALAVRGYGPWAIIGQQVAAAVVSTTLIWFSSPWRPRFVFSRSSLNDLGQFGANVFSSRILFYVNRNADNMLVGRYLGAASLGAYTIAYNLMLLPFSQIASPLQEVLFPAFSRMQQDTKRLAEAWLGVNRMVGAISIPALLGLIAVAPDFVDVVLGPKWESAVRPIQILCWVGLLQSLQGLNSAILEARNRTQLLLRYAVIVTGASVTAFVVGLHWGLVGVAAAYAISSTIVEPLYTRMTAGVLGISVFDFARALKGVTQASVVMLVAVVAARMALVSAGTSPALRLVLLILLGIAVYVPVCAWREPELRRLFVGLVARRRVRRASSAQPAQT